MSGWYVAWDGKTYPAPPPPGWTERIDGRYWPPDYRPAVSTPPPPGATTTAKTAVTTAARPGVWSRVWTDRSRKAKAVIAGSAIVVLAAAVADDSSTSTEVAAESSNASVEIEAPRPSSELDRSLIPAPTTSTTSDAPNTTAGTATTTIAPAVFDPSPVLASLEVVDAHEPGEPYDRDTYQPGGWGDADGDCQNTRHEVLIRESEIEPVLSENGCFVESGRWTDPYTGEVYTDARDVTIDHVVPLAEGHRAGGWAWSGETREAFANDLDDPGALAIAGASVNQSKGDSPPDVWRPPDESAWCGYAQDWANRKAAWGLTVRPAELAALEEMLATCDAEFEIRPFLDPGPTTTTSAPTTTTTEPTTTTTAVATTTSTTAAPATTADPACDPNYSGCVPIASDVDCAGGSGNGPAYVRGPVQVLGRDIYGLDRDNDGIGCE